VLTGHSLGAGIAAVLAMVRQPRSSRHFLLWCSCDGLLQCGCAVTFTCPRASCSRWCATWFAPLKMLRADPSTRHWLPRLRCHLVSPVGGLLSRGAADATEAFTLSLTLRDEAVTRLSRASVEVRPHEPRFPDDAIANSRAGLVTGAPVRAYIFLCLDAPRRGPAAACRRPARQGSHLRRGSYHRHYLPHRPRHSRHSRHSRNSRHSRSNRHHCYVSPRHYSSGHCRRDTGDSGSRGGAACAQAGTDNLAGFLAAQRLQRPAAPAARRSAERSARGGGPSGDAR